MIGYIMGSLREKLLEEDHQRALAQMAETRKPSIDDLVKMCEEQAETVKAINEQVQVIQSWIDRQDTIALEESEY